MLFPRATFTILQVSLCLYNFALQAQEAPARSELWREVGLPYIQNLSPKDYGGEIQNFSPVQDQRGLMYFGNHKGVLVYDGVSWRCIPIPNKSLVRSLCVVGDTIYVGAQGELGFLASEANGRLRYTSLLDEIPAEHRRFKDVYDTVHLDNAIYFRTRHLLIRWQDGRMRIWHSQPELGSAFAVRGKLYISQRDIGLLYMLNDSLHLAPGGAQFADSHVPSILPFDNTRSLIVTFAHGLFLYDGVRAKKFSTEVDSLLDTAQVRDAVNLPNGLIALVTLTRGAILIDRSGNLCQILTKASGLRDDVVLAAYPDRQGGLWLALNNGIARVETPAPISRFYSANGFESFVESLHRHDGTLYAASDRGVSYLDDKAWPFARFRRVEGIAKLSFWLLTVNNRLIVATQNAMFEITGARAVPINELRAKSLYQSGQDSNRVFVGLIEGLAELRLNDGHWLPPRRFADIDERIIGLVEDEDGTLWAGTLFEGVLKIQLNEQTRGISGQTLQAELTRYGEKHGLPQGRIVPALVSNRIVYATLKGLRRFDGHLERFLPDSSFGSTFADTTCAIFFIREDTQRNVWMVANIGERTLAGKAVPQSDGGYEWLDAPFRRINDLGNVYMIYPEQDGVVWFGGSEGIARYTSDFQQTHASSYAVLIRSVRGVSADTVFYHGGAVSEASPLCIASHDNSLLRFEFAALSFDDVTANRYKVKLDGFDNNWSRWSPEPHKDYTHLPAGDYVFRVRARNVHGQISQEASYPLTILPPWYQTWWAYLFYSIAGAAAIFAIVRVRVRHLERKTAQLEKIIDERTATIREQAEKLKELDRMKSRFFANISHEFRTPLTLILGPLEKQINSLHNKPNREELSMMRRHARRLLRLINQLLNLSRLESGRLQLQASRGDLVAVLRSIVMSFASLAEQKQITLSFQPPEGVELSEDLLEIYFDRDKIEQIFYNLLSNAFKFTAKGGRIEVEVTVIESKDMHSSSVPVTKFVEVKVRDTGIGIPQERLPYIFDRFYQFDGSSTRQHEGAGIGLALTQELVKLHHGQIEVNSEESKGSEFIVRLPVGKAHLSPDNIASPAAEYAAEDFEPALPPAEIEERVAIHENPPSACSQESPEAEATIVLVVDDHSDMRQYIRASLPPVYQVIEASDGRSGAAQAAESIPDLVISDVMMPERDGYQLCKILKTDERTSHIPVILLTAKAGEQDKLTGLETGADDYLVKPFSASELLVRSRNLIEQRRKLRQRFVREGLLRPREVAVTSVDEAFLQKLMAFIEENMADEGFGVEKLSDELHIGPRQLHRKIRGLTGQSPRELIRSVRLHRARNLLQQKAGSVSEVAFQVGFNSLSHFAKVFRDEFGILPSEASDT